MAQVKRRRVSDRSAPAHRRIRKLLVANRGEIAIRICRAATELGLRTVTVYSREDRFALHRFKSDESYLVGAGLGPVQAYMASADMIRIAREAGVDAVHPGYGFQAEDPEFAEDCAAAGLTFIGPAPAVMRRLGNKISARALAEEAGLAVMPASGPLPVSDEGLGAIAAAIGYPLMLKASWGGGGRGMRVIRAPHDLLEHVAAGRREAKAAFGEDEVYLEKLVEEARHVEVQILGDAHGTVVHLYERDCTMQRRHQKVVERAPAIYLDEAARTALCEAALRLARAAGYVGAGTVEFLMDRASGRFYFIEVNPRIQVEHTVTEQVTGIDLVKAQIRVAEGARIGELGLPAQGDIRLNGHALQCRITSEDPENQFIPDYGRITAYRGAMGFGIRLDGGTAYSGAIITPYYDSLLEKVTAWAPTADEAMRRMNRALREFRIRGVKTNLPFLEALIGHPRFLAGDYTTRFIDDTPELFKFAPRRDRATRLLTFLGEVMVNGNPEVRGRPRADSAVRAVWPRRLAGGAPEGWRQAYQRLGADGVAKRVWHEPRVLITDTTFRDAPQSLLATRVRSYDLLEAGPAYAEQLAGLFSLECWGGATFDVAMRFLREDPWERLAGLRERVPNILLQMLLRGANAVGYSNYPDNVVRYFVKLAAEAGIDVFRIFDSLNWVENMRVAMDAVLETGALCEAAICYSGDLSDPAEAKYTLDYYLRLADALKAAGAHMIAVKDMAGVIKPRAAATLVGALRREVGLPVHFHTHDTTGLGGASALAAIAAGADIVDAAMDAMSGLTSQPNLGALVEALRGGDRDPGLERETLRAAATYWEGVRRYYRAFESDLRSGMAEVYEHAMPGGQYTNLREQARAVGVDDSRWHEVARAYAEVNRLFGNVVKVTPTSKVVGDMAIYMVTNELSAADVLDPARDIAFPQSVVEFFRGEIGQPHGGFPQALQRKVLKGQAALTVRPGAVLPAVDLAAKRAEAEQRVHRQVSDRELASYLLYPKVFVDYALYRRAHGDVSALPTMAFFYGIDVNEELTIHIERGKALIVRCLAVGEPNDEGQRSVFFELNGQPRTVRVQDRRLAAKTRPHRKAEDGNRAHVAASMPGLIVSLAVAQGDRVRAGDRLLTIEAMKMETALYAEVSGRVAEIVTPAGTRVDTKDLLLVLAADEPKPS
ncbi:MAG: pyruvate carboxylase [Alphaproteobacteria bacterium]|nr:pyruvate carboxylase [Alphaproteobacteria bacterium]